MKSILLFLADGFEEIEALTVVDYLRRLGIVVDTCSITGRREVKGAHEIIVLADKILGEIGEIKAYDGVVIPGGMPGSTNLRDNKKVIEIVQEFNKDKKLIGAICAGPIVLEEAGILENIEITSYPGFEEELGGLYKEDIVVQDKNIITARGPAVAVYFALKIVENLLDKNKVEDLKKDILLDMVENYIKA